MPSLFYLPKVVSLPFAKLTFSQTGTSTLQNVYTDADLQVAHTNPVVADSAGVFEPIYLDPTLPDYRVRLTTTADVLIYQVDDVPSNQNVQQSMRLESTNPNVFLYDTDGTSGARKYRIRAAGNAFEVQAVNDAESVFTTILQFVGGVLYSNATEVAVTSAGSFTGILSNGFTTTPTGTIYYRKVNNIVHLWATAALVGTSNSGVFTMSGLPVELRPASTKLVVCGAVRDNAVEQMLAQAIIAATGDIDFRLAAVSGTSVVANGSGFTGSGSKGINQGWTISYALD
jgi:hypothetical protein